MRACVCHARVWPAGRGRREAQYERDGVGIDGPLDLDQTLACVTGWYVHAFFMHACAMREYGLCGGEGGQGRTVIGVQFIDCSGRARSA